jgi:hypothetical protein
MIGRRLTRIAGIALVAAGVAGLAFCIVGLFLLARVQRTVEQSVMEQVELVDRSLTATAEGLAVAEITLAQAMTTVESTEVLMVNVGQAINSTVPAVDAVAGFLGKQLPATIQSTQNTLIAAASTARVVDDVLAMITTIPLLRTDQYDPDVPLYKGLTEVATSLDEIPNSLGTAQEGLTTVSGDLQGLGDDLSGMAGTFAEIAGSIASAQSVLAEYQEIVADLKGLVAKVRHGLPEWLRWLRLGLSLVLVWLGIAQIGLMTQGWDLIRRSRSPGEEE